MGGRARKPAALAAALLLVAGAAAYAAPVQQGNLRVSISTRLSPYKLPRRGTAPVAAFIAGHIAAVDGGVPPQLQKMDVKINRHGVLDFAGLPACRLPEIQAGTNQRALARCGGALIGAGHFWASVVFDENRPFHTTGRLLIFNGTAGGKPVLLAHISTSIPFPSSFVITFAIHHLRHGRYGTELSASLPEALGTWGFVNRIKLNLRRKYPYHGQLHSYLNAGCPAPAETPTTVFPLALASFSFAGGQHLQTTITRSCGVSE